MKAKSIIVYGRRWFQMLIIHNPNCDGDKCKSITGQIRKLPMGGGSNGLMCRDCCRHEIEFRRERNKTLEPFAKFALPDWSQLEIYGGNE